VSEERKVLSINVILLTGASFMVNVPYPTDRDTAYVGWVKSVKSDGFVITPQFCLPWHAIAALLPQDMVQQATIMHSPTAGNA